MKEKFIATLTVLTLAFAAALPICVQAQTTTEGPGPSEQPSAPMEMGQIKPDRTAQPTQTPKLPEEAQPGGPSGEAAAETDQGVGRISMTHGEVSTQRGDSGTWSAAVLNQPVVNGDKVSTGAGGRAEVQLDYANILRLGSNAQATIANFTHKYIQIQVGQGLVNYSVFGESEAEPEIDTPNVAVHPAHKDGVFRVEVHPDGDSVVIVRKGEAEISTPQGIGQVKQGEMATVRLWTDDEVDQDPAVKTVFDEIRRVRGSDFVNNFWRALANDAANLKRTWESLKAIMGGEGALDPLTRELIYIAVSTANGCSYCIHSHTAAAKQKGMTEAQHMHLLAIIGMASETNNLATAMQIPVDREFSS